MFSEYKISTPGMRLLSKANDIRSLPFNGDGYAVDGSVVAINADGVTSSKVVAGSKDFGVVVSHHTGKSGRSEDGKIEAYIAGDIPPVMTMGRIWVKPDEVITARGKEAKVYVNTTTGLLSQTAAGNTELFGAYWDQPDNSDGLAVVNLG